MNDDCMKIKACENCGCFHDPMYSPCAGEEVPAEPDSGIQDKEICFCGQLIAKHDQSHDPRPFKEVLGEQKKRVCSLCGVRFGEDVKVCPTDGHPIISVLTDAPADHVERVGRKALELIAFLESSGWIILHDDKYATQRKTLEQVIELRFKELLSSPRSHSPATSVSASPDFASWTVIHYEHPHKIWQIWQGDKHITNSTDGDVLNILAAAHNATLPAPRRSDVSGVALNKCADCGTPLNEGEAVTFTVCDVCWDLKSETLPRSGSEVSGVDGLADLILGKWSLCQQLGENGEYYPVGDPEDQRLYLIELLNTAPLAPKKTSGERDS